MIATTTTTIFKVAHLAGEELDQLPDDGLWRDGDGGGQLLAPGQEQLGVECLQHWQALWQGLDEEVGGQVGQDLPEGGDGEAVEKGGGLPLFASLEEREDPLQGEPWRHVRDRETRHLTTASHLGVRPPSSSSQDSPLPLLAALCVAAELELLNQLPAKKKTKITLKD